MATNVTFNGVTYAIPNAEGEDGWSTDVTNFLVALADRLDNIGSDMLNFGSATTLTVTSGNTITVTKSAHRIDTSGGDETVSTINGGTEGDIVFLSCLVGGIVIFDEAGNINVPNGTRMYLGGNRTWTALRYTGSDWEIASAPSFPGEVAGVSYTRTVSGTTLDGRDAVVVTVNVAGGSATVDTITGVAVGRILVVRCNQSGGNNLTIQDSATLSLSTTSWVTNSDKDCITFISLSATQWMELSRSDN